jgi:hypothetical protein
MRAMRRAVPLFLVVLVGTLVTVSPARAAAAGVGRLRRKLEDDPATPA